MNKIFKFEIDNYYKVRKIRKVAKPFNPNSDFGESKAYHTGKLLSMPIVGQPLLLYPASIREEGIRTSPITKIEGNIIHTLNSVYEVEKTK